MRYKILLQLFQNTDKENCIKLILVRKQSFSAAMLTMVNLHVMVLGIHKKEPYQKKIFKDH